MEQPMTISQEDYKWPGFEPEIRPIAPPPASTVITRITPIDCSPKCDDHWPERQAFEAIAEKASILQKELDSYKEKMEILAEPEERKCKNSTYNEDYKTKGLSRYKYQSLLNTIDLLSEMETKINSKSLVDNTEFLKFPHPLPATGRPHPVTMSVGKLEKHSPHLSEYQDGISRNGLAIAMASQRIRCPMGSFIK